MTQSATGLNRPEAQNLLGRFLFSGWDMHERQVGALSGGERRRLALALVVASGANFLVLDEPTNHLDLESREALEAALDAFPGTVLLVSHDRALLDARRRSGRSPIEDGTARVLRRRLGRLRPRRAAERESMRRSRSRSGPSAPPKPASSRSAVPPRELDELEGRIEAQQQLVAHARGEARRGLDGRGHDRRAPPGARGAPGTCSPAGRRSWTRWRAEA